MDNIYSCNKTMKKIVSVFFIIVLSFSLTSCKEGSNSKEKQIINYNLESEPVTLDPQIATDYSSKTIIMNIFEGLTRLDENQKACEGVAKTWESNQDHTSYTFHLRSDSIWSNDKNTSVTAHDFVFGIKRTVMRDTHYENVDKLYCIKNAKAINMGDTSIENLGVRALDDYTLVIDMEYPYKDLPQLVATAPFMPCNSEFFKSTEGQYGREFDKIMGNGPFKIKNKNSWIHYQKISLSLNEDYTGPNVPLCAGVTFKIGEAVSDPISLINSKKLDASIISGSDITTAKENNLNLIPFKDVVWGLCFNSKDKFFKNDGVRSAFIEAIDRDYMLESIPENCSKTSEIMPDTLKVDGSFYREVAKRPEIPSYNKESAKSNLKLTLKSLGIGEIPTITVMCPDDPKVKSMISRMIENWNHTFNIYVNMKPVSLESLSKNIRSNSYQIAVYSIKAVSEDPIDFLSNFESNNKNNFIKFNNTEYDDLIKNVTLSVSFEEKIKMISNLEKLIVNQKVFYPLYNEIRCYVCSKDVQNILFHPYDNGIDFTKCFK